jgi:hypothetical protein
MHKHLYPSGVVAATLAATLALAACGSSGSSDATTAAAGSTGTQSSASSTTPSGGNGRPMMSAKVQACLKQAGVTLPTRPAGAGGFRGGQRPPGGYGGTGTTPGGGYGGPRQGGGYGGAPQGTGTTPQGTGTAGAPPRGGARRGFGGNASQAQRTKLQAAFKKCGVTFGQGGARQRPDVSSPTYQAAVTKYVACVRKNGYDLPDPDFSGKGPIFDSKIQSDAKFQAASKPCQSLLQGTFGGRRGSAAGTQPPATTPSA